MAVQFSNALLITLIGMGLVFSVILLIWGLMALLVRLVRDPIKEKLDTGEQSLEEELKRRAAVAAVTVALARESSFEPHEFPLPPTALVSAWQAVMRSRILHRRGPVR
jgi:Na+-transporting methylmalonyl-CoA/oxaloacetate decarboxylase gamma subunit